MIDTNSSYLLEDKGYEVERWLLNTAPQHIDHNILKFVKEEIEIRKKNYHNIKNIKNIKNI